MPDKIKILKNDWIATQKEIYRINLFRRTSEWTLKAQTLCGIQTGIDK